MKGKKNYGGSQKQWQSPEPRTLKLNVNIVCDESCRNMGLRIIARDNLERNVQAWAVARERAINPMVAEIDAVRVVILLAQQNGRN